MADTVADDPFDGLLSLEDRFYDEGYRQGDADGRRAGLVEGRTLGLETGFSKFAEAGRLQGKAVMWANRLYGDSGGVSGDHEPDGGGGGLPPLPRLPRLEKNVRLLYALVEPDTLSTANTDEAVNDFDDRVKRAQGKARILDKMVGELAAAARTPREAPAAARPEDATRAALPEEAPAEASASSAPTRDGRDAKR